MDIHFRYPYKRAIKKIVLEVLQDMLSEEMGAAYLSALEGDLYVKSVDKEGNATYSKVKLKGE